VKFGVALFCGHKSPYGLAHIMPIVDEYDVRVVVIGTDDRWNKFREILGGKIYYTPRCNSIRDLIRRIAIRVHIVGALRLVRNKYKKDDWGSLRRVLRSRNIDIWEIYDVNREDAIMQFKKLNVDLFISAAYPQIFSESLLEIPKMGAVNFHPALLPRYRGAHPHFWQIVNGEKEAGITAHFMTKDIDKGDIIEKISFSIEDCSYNELYSKIINYTPQLVKSVRLFFEEGGQAKPQNPEIATYYRNDREIHRRIFWNIHSSKEINNLIRTGKAFCFFRGKRVIISSAYATESNRNLTNGVRVENGTIVDIGNDSISVKTIDGCINIREVIDCFKCMSFLKWARKRNVYVGEKYD